MNCSTLGLPVHYQLPEFTQTHVHWVSDAIQPISSSVVPFSSCLQSFFLFFFSIFLFIMVFSNESALLIRWPKNWSFSLSISPSNEYSGLISFRMDWLDLLAVQGTLKSLNTTVQKHQFFALSFLYKPLTKVIWFIYSQRRGSCLYQSSLAG